MAAPAALAALAALSLLFVVPPALAGERDWPAFYRFLAEERWGEAIAYAEAADLASQGDGEDLFQAARAFNFAGELAAAERWLLAAIARGGREPRFVYELAVVRYLRGDLDRAERGFREVLSGGPPLEVRQEIHRFLRDIRAENNLRWDLSLSAGRDPNINGGYAAGTYAGVEVKKAEQKSAWYLEATPSLEWQRETGEGSSVWLRPYLPLRFATLSEYSRWGAGLQAGINRTVGRTLLRPSVRVSYTDSKAQGWFISRSLRLAAWRGFGRASLSPFVRWAATREEGSVRRPRERGWGVQASVRLARDLSLTVAPARTKLYDVPATKRAAPFNEARRDDLTLGLEWQRGTWSLAPEAFYSTTRYNEHLLTRTFGLKTAPRRDTTLRFSAELGNEAWSAGAFTPTLRLSTEKRRSNDPRFARERETGLTLGFRRLF